MLRARQRLGKYRIDRRIHQGPEAVVYAATDTIESVPVALKIPYAPAHATEQLKDFRDEVRLTAKLDHPNVLPIKNADFIDGRFVIAAPLGTSSLAERLKRRLAVSTSFSIATQIVEGLSHAHQRRIIHCDVKPDNVIMFPGNVARLTDFGISRLALRTISASGSGTAGYVAPEQAHGKPRFASDVFSASIVIYEMLSGTRPEWPFKWPLPAITRLRRNAPASMVELLRRGLEGRSPAAVSRRGRHGACAPPHRTGRRTVPRTTSPARESMSAPEVFRCAGGEVAALCVPAPHRGEEPGQDAALVASLSHDDDECVLAVADGAGGHRGGAEAAALAVESLSECLFEPAEGRAMRERIFRGFERGHERIAALGVGAATTLAVAHIRGVELSTYHVGDSTVLQVGQRGVRKHLTVWHSPVGYQMAAGSLDEADAVEHDEAHLVLHLLGVDDLKVEMSSGLRIAPRDTLVIASDGLLDNASIDEVTEIIRKGSLDRSAGALASLASRRMVAPKEGEPSKPDDLAFLVYRRSAR